MNKTNRLKAHRQNTLLETLMSPEISILLPLIVLCIYTSTVSPTFFKLKNIQVIIRYCAFIGALAIGQAFALMTGEIDLSVGTCSTLTSIIFACTIAWGGQSVAVAVVVTLLVGILVGCVNAFFTLVCKMNSWIVTISMQYVCIGLATVICKGKSISGLGKGITAFCQARPLGLSWMIIIVLAILVLTEIITRFTPVGRKIHAVGLSVEAARVAGIHVNRVKALSMIFCSFMASVCGILQCISNTGANASTGEGNEFPSIICCVIGGVSTNGGKGSMLGVLLGVVMYQTLKNCLQMLGFSNNAQLVLTGLVLVLAVCFDILKSRIKQKSGR